MKYSKLPRFYIADDINLGQQEFSGDIVGHLSKSLRLRSGDEFRIFNQESGEFLARIESISSKAILVEVESLIRSYQDRPYLGIAMAIIKYENFAKAIDMACQIGVTHIIPVIAERSQGKEIKIEKLKKTIINSVQQSERLCVPTLDKPIILEKLLLDSNLDHIICADENQGQDLPMNVLNTQHKNVALVGPEGGWSDEEIVMLNGSEKVRSVSLGDLVLRSETAAAVLLTKVRGLYA